ncbi:MAG: hypothetical protein HC884_18570 [Chloroflexaceae bacterium]|nr:hypothetical protein [Chloroflexaceae bacterium]
MFLVSPAGPSRPAAELRPGGRDSCPPPALCLLLRFLLGSVRVRGGGAFAQGDGQEEPPPVRLEVEAGYDGHYVTGHWFPVTITVSNDGPDVQGILEWDFLDGNDHNTFQREIDLPRGSQKRVMLSAFSGNFRRTGEVRLRDGNTLISRQVVQIEPIDWGYLVIGVLSSDATLLNSLSSIDMNNASTSVLHLNVETLPEHPRDLAGIDVLFVHDIPTDQLSTEQVAALKMWVRLGGQLIVSGGASARQATPGLADLLPVTVLDLEDQAALTSLTFFIQKHTPEIRETLPERTTVSSVELKPGAESLDLDGHLVAHEVGNGRVVFCRFDLSVLRAWAGEPDLWDRVVLPPVSFAPTSPSFGFRMLDVLQLPSLELPSFWVLVLFMGGYIVTVGPLNFLVLRLVRRSELAWVTIPATVFVFVAGTYGVNLLLRGTDPEVMQLAVVQGFEGQDEQFATAYVGLFSPYRNTYTMTFPPETLVSEEDLSFSPLDVPVTWTESATELRQMLVDVSSLRIFVTERTIEGGESEAPFQVQIQSRLQGTGVNRQWTIQNIGHEPTPDALLVYGDLVQGIGTMMPGETRTVRITNATAHFSAFTFPAQFASQEDEIFRRGQILSSLAQNWTVSSAAVPALGIHTQAEPYVLFWREQPLMEVQVNGKSVPQDGLTLYVIQLNG